MNEYTIVDVAEMKIRKGTKEPWIEIVVKKKDGTLVKLIARKVSRFWSEKDEPEGELI